MTCSDRLRAVWLSDVHLGSRACHAGLLLDFLRRTDCDSLYLVGDILDIESLRRSFYWPPSHTEVVQLILEKSRAGTRVVYVPGNHDHDMRSLCGVRFGQIEVRRRTVHTTRTGKRLLVLHGDEFDGLVKCSAFAAVAGSAAYRMLMDLNRFVHRCRELAGLPYWSLAQHVKQRIGNAQRYVDDFQSACLRAAAEAGVDGVVCGHIHQAALIERDGLVYCNDGDWVESCTALVEHQNGALELVAWPRQTVVQTTFGAPLSDAA